MPAFVGLLPAPSEGPERPPPRVTGRSRSTATVRGTPTPSRRCACLGRQRSV